jgi:hypothetical protein
VAPTRALLLLMMFIRVCHRISSLFALEFRALSGLMGHFSSAAGLYFVIENFDSFCIFHR